MTPKTTHLLLILDGWGHRTEEAHNAIAQAHTPNWDELLKNYPNAQLSGSGLDVGLPEGQMGNSEVGHMNMGAGRVVYQDLTRINYSIETSGLADSKVMLEALNPAEPDKTIHLMGLLSEGGVHSHENHLFAIIDLFTKQHPQAESAPRLSFHLFLDGRDTPPKSAKPSIERLQACIKTLRESGFSAQITTLCGRFYGMDRDQRWERIQAAYAAIMEGKAHYQASNPIQALEAAYERGETDEFVAPTLIRPRREDHSGRIQDSDTLIFFNFRADRARQISQAISLPNFSGFERIHAPQLEQFVTMARYSEEIPSRCAFESINLNNTLSDCLAQHSKHQLRIAETEKYAHVTFFFNGGTETPAEGEERVLIPSPQVKTYDLAPKMSLPKLTDTLCKAIRGRKYDLIVCNIANGDMVGHTGNFEAAVQAAQAVDLALGEIEKAINEIQGECLITADHGNIEQMVDPNTKAPHTAHTSNPVPLVYIGSARHSVRGGILSDLAPTLLDLMELPIPTEMTGQSLVER